MKNVVFCGFGELGQKCLQELVNNNFKILYVLTHEDNTTGSVDEFSQKTSIPYSYDDLRKKTNYSTFDISTDCVLISINYRFILPVSFLNLFKFSINIHGSLLPKYRGRTPHVWAIINGEKTAGITCHIIDKGIDTGPLVLQKKVVIDENDTGYTLLKKYENIYPSLLIESLNKLSSEFNPVLQDETLASFYGKREPIMGHLNFNDTSTNIINFVRAQAFPYPGAYAFLVNGQKILIDKIETIETPEFHIKSKYQLILKDKQYYVQCKDAILKVLNFRKG